MLTVGVKISYASQCSESRNPNPSTEQTRGERGGTYFFHHLFWKAGTPTLFQPRAYNWRSPTLVPFLPSLITTWRQPRLGALNWRLTTQTGARGARRGAGPGPGRAGFWVPDRKLSRLPTAPQSRDPVRLHRGTQRPARVVAVLLGALTVVGAGRGKEKREKGRETRGKRRGRWACRSTTRLITAPWSKWPVADFPFPWAQDTSASPSGAQLLGLWVP